jgi:hypothetical protein
MDIPLARYRIAHEASHRRKQLFGAEYAKSHKSGKPSG